MELHAARAVAHRLELQIQVLVHHTRAYTGEREECINSRLSHLCAR
jgi:hypothetical protein